MNSIEMLNNTINNMMATLPDDDIPALVNLMALIDERYNINDSIQDFNNRLRNNVKNNFNKILLRDEYITSFCTWKNNLENLPDNASRLDIFSAAPSNALYVVGL